MANDQLFRKRQQRKIAERRQGKRAPYDRVLIVCEGAKTEPNYFRALINHYHLSSANIKVLGEECGSDPLSIVDFTIKTYKNDKDYDRVYCVFDKEGGRPGYQEACNKARDTKLSAKVRIEIISSNPCFEVWLLLHFLNSDAPFSSGKNKGICGMVVEQLKKYIPEYDKGHSGIFDLTSDNMHIAINRAKTLQQKNQKNGSDNPATNVYELVEYLIALKK